MLLSELISQSPCPKTAFGVEVDCDSFSPPEGLTKLAILWKGDAPDHIDEGLVDIIIGYTLAGVEIILEIRPTDVVDATYIMTLAGNAGFSVSLVPPASDTQEAGWHALLEDFSRALMTTGNFSKSLFPITGYFSYLMVQRYTGVDAIAPSDGYVLDRFVNACSEQMSDAGKVVIAAALHDAVGGEEEMGALMDAMMMGIMKEGEKILLSQAPTPPNA